MDYMKNTSNIILLCLLIVTAVLIFAAQNLRSKSILFSSKSTDSKDELQIALEKASMADKTVIIAIINDAYVEHKDDQYPTMFDLFLEGFWAGEGTRSILDHVLVVAIDNRAYERCEFERLNCYRLAVAVASAPASAGGDPAKEKIYMSGEFIELMWRRTAFLLEILKRGYSFIFTDADVIWLRNPFTQLSSNRTIDFQISCDTFNGDATSTDNQLNTGFYFIRSNNRTVSLFESWYAARVDSAGMKEQDVLTKMVTHDGMLEKLGIHTRFLETRYFSGFCQVSDDVRFVVTVHANCCRTIKAKVIDLKKVLVDWKRFKMSASNNTSSASSSGFVWSKHDACVGSML